MSTTRPEPMFTDILVDMGFPENRAAKAVSLTHNCGVEPAVSWLMEHGDDADIDEPLPGSGPAGTTDRTAALGTEAWAGQGQRTVMGIPSISRSMSINPDVVNPDGATVPAMLVGVGCECKLVLVVAQDLGMSPGKIAAQCAHATLGVYRAAAATVAPWLGAWEEEGEKTVVLSAPSSSHLDELAHKAHALGLPHFMVCDAGRTEVRAGSRTVLGIAGASEMVDKVTGQLSTLQ